MQNYGLNSLGRFLAYCLKSAIVVRFKFRKGFLKVESITYNLSISDVRLRLLRHVKNGSKHSAIRANSRPRKIERVMVQEIIQGMQVKRNEFIFFMWKFIAEIIINCSSMYCILTIIHIKNIKLYV